jgi:hypothetical protein
MYVHLMYMLLTSEFSSLVPGIYGLLQVLRALHLLLHEPTKRKKF